MRCLFWKKKEKRYENPLIREDATRAELNKWKTSEFVVERIVPFAGYVPYPLDELMLMVEAVCIVNPSLIFEWGTHIGKSAWIFHETCRCFHVNAEIYSIDLPDSVEHAEHPHEERGRMVRGLKGVTLHQGDGVTTALSLLSQENRRGGRALFFLDGDHAYQSVRRELEAILTTTCWRGILVHDTFFQTEEAQYNIGPYQAVRDIFCDKNDVVVHSTAMGLPGMTLILPKDG